MSLARLWRNRSWAAVLLAKALETCPLRELFGPCGDLLRRARLPQLAQQHGHGGQVIEADVGGGG